MNIKWRIDNANTVELAFKSLGKRVISVNGGELLREPRVRSKTTYGFVVPNTYKRAALTVSPQFFGQPACELRIDGRLMVPATDAVKCRSCGSAAKPYDAFCPDCGAALPSAEHYVHKRQLKEANNAIRYLAILYMVVGIFFLVYAKHRNDGLLSRLQNLAPTSTYPHLVGGKQYTVSVMREKLSWEPWSILIVYAILAIVMGALFLWSKRSPLAAILVASATYLVMITIGAVVDPRTIGQGLIIKIMIIALLAKGVKSALALRAHDA